MAHNHLDVSFDTYPCYQFRKCYMLSICTTVKNRSRVPTDKGILYLFPNCIKSLASSLTLDCDAELVIADWDSEDWPIREWIEDTLPNLNIHIVNIQADGFSAGKGRNIAAEHSNGDLLFFMDADMIVNADVIRYGITSASNGQVFYPVVRYEIDGGKTIIHEGGGNLFLSKEVFIKSGRWPEYWKHGFEDTDYAATLKKIAPIAVKDTLEIFHQWHPQTKLFKDAHSKEDKKVDERREYYKTKVNGQTEILAKAIDYALNHDPNTTHHDLYRPVHGQNGRMLI